MTAAATRTGHDTRDVIVVGAGISGLTVAWHLRRAGVDCALLEAGPRVGGSIQTERRAGFLLEKGPFNVIVRDPAFEELLDGVADRSKVVTAAAQAKNRYIYRHGAIHIVPTDPLSLLHTPLLSFGGALRAIRGLFISARGRQAETTLEEFAVRRFGREAADTLVSAAIAGILAGDIRQLSAYACFPVLKDFDQKSFSPLGRTARRIPNMIRKRRNPALRRKWKGLVSIDSGLGGLCAAIADALEPDVYTDCRVAALRPKDGGFALTTVGAAGTRELHCRRLALATPAHEAARLLEGPAPLAGQLLASIRSASLTVINLGFRRTDIAHPLDGFGFLVPHHETAFPLMGVLWADSAFPHHAPPEYRLLRAFFGGARTPDVMQRDADELVRTAIAALRPLLGITGEPVLVEVCPYPSAIPQYHFGHEAKIARVREAVARVPGLSLAGNYLAGVSINDCIKLGKQVAGELLRQPSRVPV
jgi:oxygen-dependent protoporphyrinogen oxidase